MNNITALLLPTLSFTAPLILAALGGLTSERSGVINIGLEGKMLGAACAAALTAQSTGNAIAGLLAGLITAILLSLLHALLTQTYRVDHIISGMGINALAAGATSLLAKTFPELASQEMAVLPRLGYWILAGSAVVLVWWIINNTRGGLRLLAVGEDPDKARQMGVQPILVRFKALTATGILTGLAGVLIASNATRFSDNMTAGRGYIALAALILSGWRAPQALLSCLAFGFLEALRLKLQGTSLLGNQIPAEFWQALPYVVTLFALAGLAGKRNRAPAGLGKP